MLTPSCKPSVTPSVATPLASPAVTERSNPLSIPDFSSIFSVKRSLAGPVRLLANFAGRIESSAAEAVENSAATPGSRLPVSWYIFWNTSGALSA